MKNSFPTACEVCGENRKGSLEKHHITERVSKNSNNDYWNLSVLCCTCHALIDNKTIEIIGLFPSTKPPGRILVYKRNGVSNIPNLETPYYVSSNYKIKV